jgi:DNA-binding response OmpR family regulator
MDLPTIRALVVDDEEGIRRLLTIALARHGIECNCASNGSDALALLQSTRYHLVVTDLRMPHGHGHSLCTALLARADRPVIVVLTGVMEPRLTDDLKARGVDKICFKPVNFRDFSDEVYHLVLERLQLLRTAAQAASGSAQVPSAALLSSESASLAGRLDRNP